MKALFELSTGTFEVLVGFELNHKEFMDKIRQSLKQIFTETYFSLKESGYFKSISESYEHKNKLEATFLLSVSEALEAINGEGTILLEASWQKMLFIEDFCNTAQRVVNCNNLSFSLKEFLPIMSQLKTLLFKVDRPEFF